MSRVEVLLVAVLITIGVLLGMIFGGSTIWFLKPGGDTKVIDKVVNRYVCADGTVKDDKGDCPVIEQSDDGTPTVVCPPCNCENVTASIYRKCDCTQCLASCGYGGPGVTTTTLHVPKCDPCESDADCGEPYYDESSRCRYYSGTPKEYKNYNEPFCDDECCKIRQTQKIIRSCLEDERCVNDQGCVLEEDEEGQ